MSNAPRRAPEWSQSGDEPLAQLEALLKTDELVDPDAAGSVMARGVEQHREPTDSPMAAFRWRRLAQVDEHGKIEPGAWLRAVAQRNTLLGGSKGIYGSIGPATPAWINRGPSNVTGRSRAFLIHPTQTNKMWTAGVGGGIWASSDSGATWSAVDDSMASLAIGCMAIDPSNPNTMYAGTGEGYFNGDAIDGAGLFQSTDGGVTWNQLASSVGPFGINRIAVCPTNSNLILMTTQYGGIQRSADGGVTWTNPWFAQAGMCVAFDPADGTQAVATTLDYDFNLNTWFTETLYSTDSGQTWTQASGACSRFNNFSDRIELAYAPSNTSIVYAESTGGVYKSTDGGHSYALVTTSNTLDEGQLWYDSAIWVDPTNPNFLVILRSNIYKSTNGGGTFTQIASGYILTQEPHPDAHYVVSDPGFNGTTDTKLYVTTDGGPFMTSDIYTASTSSGWSPVGAQVTGQYYGAAGEGISGTIIGGLQDNGTLITSLSSSTATSEFGGDGGFCAIDPTNANFVYGEYVDLLIQRSTTGGGGANYITSGLSDAGSNANFIAPFVLDPNNVNRLVAGGASVWVCNNAKAATPTWSSIKGPSTNLISAIAIAPGNSNVIWVGQNDGAIYMTSNGTAASPTWTTINNNSSGTPIPDRYIGRIAIDPANSNHVYIGIGGYTAGNLWETTNNGVTWIDIAGTGSTALPMSPIRGIAIDPALPGTIYVGTEVGFFATSDDGSAWTTSAFGPANVSVDELVFMENSNSLLAATHGRGVWTADLTTVLSLSLNPTSQTGGQSVSATVTLNRPAPVGGTSVTISSSSGLAQPPSPEVVPAGQTTVTFNIPTSSVSSQTNVTITAAYGTSQQSAILTLNPGSGDTVKTLTFSANPITGGLSLSGTVTLTSPAPTGGQVVTLASNNTPVAKPNVASITVPAGANSKAFGITTTAVTTSTAVQFTATATGSPVNATLTVRPIPIKSLTISPNSVPGGTSTTGTVTLYQPAAPGNLVVNLTSANSAATVPATVSVTAGQTTANFTINTSSVTSVTTGNITATLNGSTASAGLTVNPASGDPVATLTFTQNPITGGVSLSGTVTLTSPAPTGGQVVTLASNNTPVAKPNVASITVPAGANSKAFGITTTAVTTSTAVQFTATSTGTPVNATLTVRPIPLKSLTISPNSVTGGTSTTGTVTLYQPAAPGNIVVTLTSTNPSVANPATTTVTILAGQTSANFTINTFTVSSSTVVTIKGTANGTTVTGKVTVN